MEHPCNISFSEPFGMHNLVVKANAWLFHNQKKILIIDQSLNLHFIAFTKKSYNSLCLQKIYFVQIYEEMTCQI